MIEKLVIENLIFVTDFVTWKKILHIICFISILFKEIEKGASNKNGFTIEINGHRKILKRNNMTISTSTTPSAMLDSPLESLYYDKIDVFAR